jgi:hypothetical protein
MQNDNMINSDALPSSLVDPLEGLTIWRCGRSWNLEPLPTSSIKGGKRGMLEVPGIKLGKMTNYLVIRSCIQNQPQVG